MATCNLYKGSTLLGAGVITNGSASVTSWVPTTNGVGGQAFPAILNRNVAVAITSSTSIGASFRTKVIADNGSGTLTLQNVSPFAT